MKLNMLEIKEFPKENNSSSVQELSIQSSEILDKEEKKYQEKII